MAMLGRKAAAPAAKLWVHETGARGKAGRVPSNSCLCSAAHAPVLHAAREQTLRALLAEAY